MTISNLDFLHYMTAVSHEMSDEPNLYHMTLLIMFLIRKVLDQVVRPPTRGGRRDWEEMTVFPWSFGQCPPTEGLGSVRPQAVVFIFQN